MDKKSFQNYFESFYQCAFNNVLSYACSIEPVGQAPAQEPQSIHLSASISNLPSPMLIAPTGHCASQAPQHTHEYEI